MATTVGEIQYKVSIDTAQLKSQMSGVKKDIAGTSASGIASGNKLSKGWAVAAGAIAGVASAAFRQVTNIITSSVSSAVKRIDTLNQFPKVLKNFGVSSEEAAKSINRIDERIRGLPTTLNSAAAGVKNLFMVTKDLKSAEDIFYAINDATMIFAEGSEDASNRFVYAYKQAMSAGKVAGDNFRQMNEAIPGLMDKVAESMGMSFGQLKEGLGNGSISIDQFNDALLKLDKEGVGAMDAMKDAAFNATGGIETAMTNAKTAVVRSVSAIINAIGTAELGSALGSAAGMFESVFSGKNIEKNTQQFSEAIAKMFGNIISNLPMWISNFAKVFTSLVQQITAMLPELIQKIVDFFKNQENITMLINAYMQLMIAITQAMPQIISALANALPDIIEAIVDYFTNPTNLALILQAAVQLFGAMIQAPFIIIGSLLESVGRIYNMVVEKVRSFAFAVQNAARDVFYRIVTAIVSLGAVIINTIGGVIQGAVNKVRSFVGAMASAAGNLIKGLIKGIGNGTKAVINKIKEICSGALDAVKKFFGIASPSKVMAQMGNYMMQGLENGIASAGAGVVSEAQKVNQAVANAFGVDDMAINPTVGAGNFSSNTIGSSSDTSGRFGSVVVNQNVVANTPVDMQIINQRLGNAVRRATA